MARGQDARMETNDSTNEHPDPAMQPVEEAGGGEAEGFEQSERELVERAENFDEHRSPRRDAFEAEDESDRSGASDGEPDEVDPTGD